MNVNEQFQQRLAVLNVRVQTVNLAFNDLLGEMGELVKAYADRVTELEKENRKSIKPEDNNKTIEKANLC